MEFPKRWDIMSRVSLLLEKADLEKGAHDITLFLVDGSLETLDVSDAERKRMIRNFKATRSRLNAQVSHLEKMIADIDSARQHSAQNWHGPSPAPQTLPDEQKVLVFSVESAITFFTNRTFVKTPVGRYSIHEIEQVYGQKVKSQCLPGFMDSEEFQAIQAGKIRQLPTERS